MTGGEPVARARAGFTLVEIAVVLAIMTLAASVVAPTLFRGNGRGPAAIARMIGEVYGTAREAAVTRGTNGLVHLDLARGDYAVLVRDDRNRAWDTVTSGQIPLEGLRLLGDSGKWAEIRFDARGRAVGDPVVIEGGSQRLVLRPRTWGSGIDVSSR